MKVNVIKSKDKYAQSCGSLDWYDHINGMSARDVELEMEYVCEQVTAEMLEMLVKISDECDGNNFSIFRNEIDQLIKQATEL